MYLTLSLRGVVLMGLKVVWLLDEWFDFESIKWGDGEGGEGEEGEGEEDEEDEEVGIVAVEWWWWWW